jgi:hypothetical protein
LAQNPYRNIREALTRLGVSINSDPERGVQTPNRLPQYEQIRKNVNGRVVTKMVWRWQEVQGQAFPAAGTTYGGAQDHQNHFHIYLKPPDRVDIGGANQLVTSMENHSISEENAVAFFDMIVPPEQGYVLLAQTDFRATDVDSTVWTGQDVQDAENFYPGLGELGQGRIIFFPDQEARTLSRGWLEEQGISYNDSHINTSFVIETQPKHGRLERIESGEFAGQLRYTPDAGFLGMDFVSFIVTIENKRIRVNMTLNVARDLDLPTEDDSEPGESEDRCLEEMSLPFGRKFAVFEDDGKLWLITDMSSVLKMDDLPSVALAQTTGTGPTAQITLDTNAAGYGWFIDYTPYLNEEWLPTSNPYEWQAKPGSDAEGKMDMLSVLLHEYGHVLGLEHSQDAHDYMATTLQPDVRRLPSAEELQLMANLVGELKGEMGLASPSGQPGVSKLPHRVVP